MINSFIINRYAQILYCGVSWLVNNFTYHKRLNKALRPTLKAISKRKINWKLIFYPVYPPRVDVLQESVRIEVNNKRDSVSLYKLKLTRLII